MSSNELNNLEQPQALLQKLCGAHGANPAPKQEFTPDAPQP